MHYFQRWAENDKARAAVSGLGAALPYSAWWPGLCCGLHLLCTGLRLLHTAAAQLHAVHGLSMRAHAGAMLLLLGVAAR